MADYIKREDALQAQNKSMNLAECRKRLERIPVADVRPVVHARWIGVALGDMRCSNCGEVYGVCGGLMGDYNFCPNCGADMREVDDG